MLQNREGQRVPQVTFRTREDGQWKDVTTDELFKGRTVVVFALPGAYTPTCSSTHLPRYNELAADVLEAGRGRDRVPLGQRRVRDERVAEGPERARTSPSSPTATASSPRSMGMLVDKSEPRLRQALVALFDAGEGRRDREDVHRAGEGRRPVRGLRRRHDAQVPRPAREGARARGDLLEARLPALRARQGSCSRRTASRTRKSTLGKGITFSTRARASPARARRRRSSSAAS